MKLILVSCESVNLKYSIYALGFVRVKFEKQVSSTEDQNMTHEIAKVKYKNKQGTFTNFSSII